MKNNPIIPYILIMAFGIGLIFFMSLDGVGNKEEIAHGGEESGETADSGAVDGESIAQAKCIGCHGGDLSGQGNFPSLHGLTDGEHIKNVILNGQGAMPGGLASEPEADALVEYILTLE